LGRLSQSDQKSVTPTESHGRPVKGEIPRPDLFEADESDDDGREELDFQLDNEMGGKQLNDGNSPTYDSESDDESIIPDDEIGHIVLIAKVKNLSRKIP
jgi:hypothetical protein